MLNHSQKKRAMIIHPYNNVTFDLARSAMFAFYEQDNGRVKMHYSMDNQSFDASKEDAENVRRAIGYYTEEGGGDYYWLFSNVAINLRQVSSVYYSNQSQKIEVCFSGGGRWSSSSRDGNREIYDAYVAHVADRAARVIPEKRELAKPTGAQPEPRGAEGGVDEAALAAALFEIHRMIGLEGAKRDIRKSIALARFNMAKRDMGMPAKSPAMHMVFTGNPGTGKTSFARQVAKVYHALGLISSDRVHEAVRENLVGEYLGKTAPKVRAQMEQARGGVLFIDEAYSLTRGKDGSPDQYGAEAVDTLVASMENMRDDLVVIVAGYPGPMRDFIAANEGLKSRFNTYLHFEDYDMQDLGRIMELMLAERGYKMTDDARAAALKQLEDEKAASAARNPAQPDFANARTVRNLVEQAEKAMALRLDEAGAFSAGLDAETRKVLLETVTAQDVAGVTLAGIAAKPAEKPVLASGPCAG
jgi:hypothetical protein